MTSRNSVCFTYSSLSTYTHSHAFFKWQETSLLLLYVLIWVHMICFGIANCVVDYGWTGPFGFDIWIGTRVVVAWQTYCSASLCGYLEVSCNLFISSDWKPDLRRGLIFNFSLSSEQKSVSIFSHLAYFQVDSKALRLQPTACHLSNRLFTVHYFSSRL